MKRLVAFALLVLAGTGRAADDELLALAPEQLPKAWQLDQRNWVEFVSAEDAKSRGCAAVSFIVEADGTTSGTRVLRTMPDGEFVDAAQRIVREFRFEPGPRNAKRTPVFTYLTISFNGRGERTLGSNIRKPVTVDSRLNRLCAVAGFDFGGE